MRTHALLLLTCAAAASLVAPAGCAVHDAEDAASDSEQAIDVTKTQVDPLPLALDGNERAFAYTASPRYYAFKLHAAVGAQIDVFAEARSPNGRAELWVTDKSFKNVAIDNPRAARAHLQVTVPASTKGELYVVVRDQRYAPGNFAVWGTSRGGDDGGTDGGAPPPPLVCSANHWLRPVPVAGHVMMAFRTKAYIFADDGKTWSIVENESALTQPIPLPDGVVEMRAVTAEIAPSGRPLVTFQSGTTRYATFWNGAAFVGTTALGQAQFAHADAAERIYAVTSNGLTELGGGGAIVRGALPYDEQGWNVGADGTVHVLHSKSRPSTIHPGDTAIDLLVTHLPHGSLTWSSDGVVASNEGQGFHGVGFAAAADGSLHIAYSLSYEAYSFRSRDGVTWDTQTFKDIVSKATLVDPATPWQDEDPAQVKGNIRLVAAQDYDHVSITLVYAQGSFSIPGFYVLRRCAPFIGINSTWPAERLAFSGMAFDPGGVAVNEVGLPTVLTPNGARQDVTP